MNRGRKTMINATVFSLNAVEYLGDLKEVTYSVNVRSEDASGGAETDEHPWATKRRHELRGTALVGAATQGPANAWIIPLAGTVVAVVWTSGGNQYSGNALVIVGEHVVQEGDLQKQSFTLAIQGAPTITTPT